MTVQRQRLQNHTIITLLVCVSVIMAGCAGFGAGEPADDTGTDSPDQSDDLEDEQDSAEGNNSSADTDSEAEHETSDSDSASESASDSTSESSSNSDTDASTSSASDPCGDSSETDPCDSGSPDDSSRSADENTSTDESSSNDSDSTDDNGSTDNTGGDNDSDDSDDTDDSEGEEELLPPSYTYTVTVEVVDADGNPIADEPVTATVNGETTEYLTGEDGTVNVTTESTIAKAVEYEITVRHDTRGLPVNQSAQTERFVIGAQEEPEPEPETYDFTVYTQEDVSVTVRNDDTREEWTKNATNGSVTFELAPGMYTIHADEHASVLMPTNVPGHTEIELQGGYDEFTVNVVDAETGDPIEGAEISGVCDWYFSSGDAYITGESNADGVIETSVISPSVCHGVLVEADEYESTTISVINIPDDDEMTIELDAASDESRDEEEQTNALVA